jgi:hypothetical protein
LGSNLVLIYISIFDGAATIVDLIYNLQCSYMIKDLVVRKDTEGIERFTSKAEKNSRFCIGCGEPATKLVKYSSEGAILVEKYCDRRAKAIEDGSAN